MGCASAPWMRVESSGLPSTASCAAGQPCTSHAVARTVAATTCVRHDARPHAHTDVAGARSGARAASGVWLAAQPRTTYGAHTETVLTTETNGPRPPWRHP